MVENMRFTFDGTAGLDGARNLINALAATETPPESVTVELTLAEGESPDTADVPKPVREPPQLKSDTNQHITLYLLAQYLEDTGSESATREDIHEWADSSPLSVSQLGNALGHLARMKEVLDVDQQDSDRGGRVNHYSMTPAAERLLDDLGTPTGL